MTKLRWLIKEHSHIPRSPAGDFGARFYYGFSTSEKTLQQQLKDGTWEDVPTINEVTMEDLGLSKK